MKKNYSWFALIAFCATTALIAALGLAILFASATVAFAVARTVGPEVSEPADAYPESANSANAAATSGVGQDETFAGLVTDDHCGARHDMGSGKSSAECSKMCVRNGAVYALVDGEKKYTLVGNNDEIGRLAGQRVTVAGSLDGDTIRVSSITSKL